MKLITLISLFILLSFAALAQQVTLLEPITPLTNESDYFTMPRISPDGNNVIFGGKSHTGLYLIDFNGTDLIKLTDASAAGWYPQWAPLSDVIAVRVNNWSNDMRNKTNSIEVIELDGIVKNISGDKPSTSLPFWSDKGSTLAWFENDSLQVLKLSDNTDDVLRYVKNNMIVVKSKTDVMTSEDEVNPEEKVFEPINGEYLFVNWSPNGMRVAVQVLGKGIYVLDVQNNQVYEFGMGEYPDWINNDVLVCMDVKDDGSQVTNGEILVMNYDGKLIKNITNDFNQPALYPSASEDGKVVFQSLNGQIFKTTLSIQ